MVNFVSLGPGSIDDVTLGTVHTLMKADRVYCFETNGNSRAKDIMCQLGIDEKKIITVDAPMSINRNSVNRVYDNLADSIYLDTRHSMNVTVATEGDSSIFATTHYVMDRLVAMGVECRQTAGVPSFIAAANVAGLHLIKQQERLVVIPGRTTADEIEQLIDSGYNLVIMKLSMAYDAVVAAMERRSDFTFHYFENVSTPEQKYMRLNKECIGTHFPYFSLMIINKREK